MLGIVMFLANKNSFILEDLENTLLDDSEIIIEKNPMVPAVQPGTVSNDNQGESTGTTPSVDVQEEQLNTNFKHALINPSKYKEKLESGEYIHIDIRTAGEYDAEKIENGLNIDFYATNFKSELDKLDKTKKYIYHCRSGSRSANSVAIFEELGFGEVLELEGGINNWKAEYPTE